MLDAPENTIVIAKIAGPYLVASGLGFLFSHAYYAKMIAETPNAHPVLINLSGAVHFVIGMAILTRTFAWAGFVEASVTLLGVAAAAKGAALIAFPGFALKTPADARPNLYLSSAGFLVAGVWYSFVGYGSLLM